MITGVLDCDASLSIETNGKIMMHVYMGEGACEPIIEGGVPLTVLIDDILDSFLLPRTKKIPDYHIEEAQELVAELKSAVKYAKRRINELS